MGTAEFSEAAQPGYEGIGGSEWTHILHLSSPSSRTQRQQLGMSYCHCSVSGTAREHLSLGPQVHVGAHTSVRRLEEPGLSLAARECCLFLLPTPMLPPSLPSRCGPRADTSALTGLMLAMTAALWRSRMDRGMGRFWPQNAWLRSLALH